MDYCNIIYSVHRLCQTDYCFGITILRNFGIVTLFFGCSLVVILCLFLVAILFRTLNVIGAISTRYIYIYLYLPLPLFYLNYCFAYEIGCFSQNNR